MYIGQKGRQVFNYATTKSCDNNPQNVIALDLDSDEHNVLTRKPVLLASRPLFESEQVQCAKSP